MRDPCCARTPVKGRETLAVAGPPWDHSSAWDTLGSLVMLCAGFCGTRALPGQTSPRVPGMATQCPHGHPNAAASPLPPAGSKSSTWTTRMDQLSQHYGSDALGDAQPASQACSLPLPCPILPACISAQFLPGPTERGSQGSRQSGARVGSPGRSQWPHRGMELFPDTGA